MNFEDDKIENGLGWAIRILTACELGFESNAGAIAETYYRDGHIQSSDIPFLESESVNAVKFIINNNLTEKAQNRASELINKHRLIGIARNKNAKL